MKITSPLDLVKLSPLMELTSGKPEIVIGLIDGPIAVDHTDLANANIREIPAKLSGTCRHVGSAACMHGTFVAGMLCAKRDSLAPAICPNCTLLLRPIFGESPTYNGMMPSATPNELAEAINDCIDAGARVINLSAALAQPSSNGERKLEVAFDHSLKRGVVVVAAAGNQGIVGSTAITRHPWIIPVIASDLQGMPLAESNLGSSIGKRGLSAPGDTITSLGATGELLTSGGTSVAAPFVTGAIALLWSEFPDATAAEIKLTLTSSTAPRRNTVVPPLMDVWRAYQVLATAYGSGVRV